MKKKKGKDYYLKNSIKVGFFYGIIILAVGIFWTIFIGKSVSDKQEFIKMLEQLRQL